MLHDHCGHLTRDEAKNKVQSDVDEAITVQCNDHYCNAITIMHTISVSTRNRCHPSCDQ